MLKHILMTKPKYFFYLCDGQAFVRQGQHNVLCIRTGCNSYVWWAEEAKAFKQGVGKIDNEEVIPAKILTIEYEA